MLRTTSQNNLASFSSSISSSWTRSVRSNVRMSSTSLDVSHSSCDVADDGGDVTSSSTVDVSVVDSVTDKFSFLAKTFSDFEEPSVASTAAGEQQNKTPNKIPENSIFIKILGFYE